MAKTDVTNKDSRVAEIIESKPAIDWSEKEESHELMSSLAGEVTFSNKRAWRLYFIYDHGDNPEWIPPVRRVFSHPRTFISVPTYETDGIVLKWVQGQDVENETTFFDTFEVKLFDLLADTGGEKSWDVEYEDRLQFALRNLKPGMYAQALLEVNDNE